MSNIIVLEGLNCQNCSAKIQDKLTNDKVIEYNFNMLNNHLKIEKSELNTDETLKYVKNVVDNIEKGINVHYADDKDLNEENEVKLGLSNFKYLFIGLIFFVIAYIAPSYNLIFYIIAYIIIGKDVIVSGLTNIKNGQLFDENFLMLIATIGAFIIGEYTEAVAVMIFFNIGETIQDYAVEKSKKSIKELINLRPQTANLVIGDEIKEIEPEKINVDDILLIKVGEKTPTDGVLISESGQLDTSTINGESIPRVIRKNEEILSGYINLNNVIYMRATKTYENSAVAKIIQLIEETNKNKGKTEQFITKFAKKYTPIVVFIALFLAIVPSIITGDYQNWIYTACVFLVVSCPCALVVSVPLTFYQGIGISSQNGILLKGTTFLEKLSNVKVAAFDKTGTLTEGVFEVSEVCENNSEFANIISSLEKFSDHPISKAVISKYPNGDLSFDNYEEIAGLGIKANKDNDIYLAGNAKLMDKHSIKINNIIKKGTVVYVSKNNEMIGYVILSDIIKTNSVKTIKHLNDEKIESYMLTGDSKNSANEINEILNVDNVYSELLPEDKLNIIKNIKEKDPSKEIIFVGDGINDAPVLNYADVGISMGTNGTDLAKDMADIIIVNDDPFFIIKAIEIAKITIRTAKENIYFSIGIKILVMILAILGFAHMGLAIFADVGVTLLAVLNAVRPKKFKY